MYIKQYGPEQEQYPELDFVAKELSLVVLHMIEERAEAIKSKMPYKPQYILEELIEHLKEEV